MPYTRAGGLGVDLDPKGHAQAGHLPIAIHQQHTVKTSHHVLVREEVLFIPGSRGEAGSNVQYRSRPNSALASILQGIPRSQR